MGTISSVLGSLSSSFFTMNCALPDANAKNIRNANSLREYRFH
jgi:hypothetical protein